MHHRGGDNIVGVEYRRQRRYATPHRVVAVFKAHFGIRLNFRYVETREVLAGIHVELLCLDYGTDSGEHREQLLLAIAKLAVGCLHTEAYASAIERHVPLHAAHILLSGSNLQ